MDPFKKPATPNETDKEITAPDVPQADAAASDSSTPDAVAESPEPTDKPAETEASSAASTGDATATVTPDAPAEIADKPADTAAAPDTASAADAPAADVSAETADAQPETIDAAKPADTAAGEAEKPVDNAAPGSTASTWGSAAPETPAAPAMPAHISAPDTPPPATPDSVSAGGMAAGGAAVAAVSVAKGAKKMRTLAVIVAAAILLLLACGASALYYVMNKPQNVLDMALSNSFSDKAKTVSFDGEVTSTDKERKPGMGLTFNGAVGQDGKFNLSAKADLMVTNITADFRSVDGTTYYARVGGLSGLPQLLGASNAAESRMLSSAVTLVNDQWLEINQSLIKETTGSNVSTKLTDSDRSKLETAYKQNKFVVVKQSLIDQTIKGVGTHHYRVGVDKAKLKSFYSAVQKANLDSMKITSDQVSMFNRSLDGAKVENYSVDVWIGKGDRMFKQVGYNKTNADHSSITFRLTVDKYNAAVNVEKPANAKSLLDVLGQFYGANGMSGMTGMDGGTGMNPLMSLPSGISL
ncbi:MAG TPA: hypothetical protein VLI54_02940 [Bacillota bacterium]|nr:hypothetical protein [Bacillota bacterium]